MIVKTQKMYPNSQLFSYFYFLSQSHFSAWGQTGSIQGCVNSARPFLFVARYCVNITKRFNIKKLFKMLRTRVMSLLCFKNGFCFWWKLLNIKLFMVVCCWKDSSQNNVNMHDDSNSCKIEFIQVISFHYRLH